MSHEYLLWIALFAYAMHVFEELVLDAITYVQKYMSKSQKMLEKVTPMYLHLIYGLVIISSICANMVGWHLPCFGLLLPTLLLIHSPLNHIWTAIKYRKFIPGIITSVFFNIPIGIACYWGAWKDQVLTWEVGIFAVLIALLFFSMPLIFLKIRTQQKKTY